jgi:hypothetical protein
VRFAALCAALGAAAIGCGGEATPAGDASRGAASSSPVPAWFVDVTSESGIDFVHDAGLTPEKNLPETMGAGAAVFDADEDGDLDLYFVQGGPMRLAGAQPGTFVEPSGALPPNRLYLNDGHGHFTDATAASGDAADTHYGMGVVVGDVNGDGHLDLFLTNLGANVLLLGDGHAHFRDATRESGIRDERWTTGCCLFDSEGDGDLDLLVTGYVLIDLAHPEWCGRREPGWRSYCHPDHYPALQERFWRNNGDGTFVDATEEAGFAKSFGKGLGVIACDVERDGDLDLYVANDSTENFLWINDGHGHFSDGTLLAGVGVDGRGLTQAGMGLAAADVDGDLDFDLFVTNFDDEPNTLYVNDGGGMFEDRTLQAGLDAPSRIPVGFGTVFEDFELDGKLDLAVANGHIIDNIQLYDDGKTHAQRAQLFANDGRGHFRELHDEAGAFGATPFVGRGLYSGDLDGDGDVDLVLTQCNGPARIFRNVREHRPSLVFSGLPRGTTLELEFASGARLLREVGPQPSYFGQCAPDVIVGSNGSELKSVVLRVPYSAPQKLEITPPLASCRLAFAKDRERWTVRAAELNR